MIISQRDSSISSESIPRFCRALRLATFDKRLERTHRSVYYYDADVVIRMITGFRQFKEDRRPVSDPRILLVRALLSSGYLGEVQLLRPHALELDEALRSKSARGGSSARGDFRSEVESFLTEWEVKQLMLRLLDIIERTPEINRVEMFLRELKGIGHTSFIALELANGNWRERLARFWRDGVILFAQPEVKMRRALGDPLMREFAQMISDVPGRRDVIGTPSANMLRDGAALSMLHRLIRRREAGENVPFVRFYTETDILKVAWARNPRMIELLSYQQLSVREGRGFIFRDTDYFIVRASFEELSFPALKRKRRARGNIRSVSLARLERIAGELEDAISQGDGKLADYLDKPLGAVPLRKYIEDFESLGFLGSIWVRYEPTKTMESFISGLREVWDFASDLRVAKLIQAESEEALRQLGEGVRDLKEWFKLFEEMQIATGVSFRGKRKFPMPDLMKDLGLVRWGIDLSVEARARYEALMALLISRDEDQSWRGCADLTDAIREAESDFDQCVIACSILWALSRFEQIVSIISRFVAMVSPGSIGLDLMRSGARMRTGKLDWQGKGRLLREMDKLVMSLGDEQSKKFLIGLGYLYFHAWEPEKQRERFGGEDRRSIEAALDKWIHRSMELGEEAAKLLPEFTLEWTYAINHCVYVGTVGGFSVDPYIDKLLQMEKIGEIWNYRFADSLAYHYYHSAKRQWEKTGRQSSQGERARMLKDVQTARDVYARAEETFGDPEIPVHLNELNRLEQRIQQRMDADVTGARGIGHPSQPDRL